MNNIGHYSVVFLVFLVLSSHESSGNELDDRIEYGLAHSTQTWSLLGQRISYGGVTETWHNAGKSPRYSSDAEPYPGARYGLYSGASYAPPAGFEGAREIVKLVDEMSWANSPHMPRRYKLAKWGYVVFPWSRIDFKRTHSAPEIPRSEEANLGNFSYGVSGKILGLNKQILDIGAGVFTRVRYGLESPFRYGFESPWGGLSDDAHGDDPKDFVYSSLGQKYINSGQYMKDFFVVKEIEATEVLDKLTGQDNAEKKIEEYNNNRQNAAKIVDSILDKSVKNHNAQAQKDTQEDNEDKEDKEDPTYEDFTWTGM